MLGCPERPGIQVPVASTQAPGGSIQVPAAGTQVSTTDAAAPVASQSWVHISQPGLTSSLTHAGWCRGYRWGGPDGSGAAPVQGARGVPQHCGASWGIRSRLGSLTPESHRYASLAGSLWLNRLAKPDRLRMP